MNHKAFEPVKERAIIVGVSLKSSDSNSFNKQLEEVKLLAKTANLMIVGELTQTLENYKSSTYVGKGKLNEVAKLAQKLKAQSIVFIDNLTSAQAKNISKETKRNVVDRTELILSIFAKHARTKISKIQVEVAQLEYSYSKLRNLWQHLSRIEGGVGTKGPGESQLEIDRRLIKKRIHFLKEKLNKIEQSNDIQKKKRDNFFKIVFVGYTNAGKSSLFNLLTKSSVYVADELFATLDPRTKLLYNKEHKIVLTDTIGFINDLPTTLISSFHSTLSDVIDADLLLHVVDISQIGADKRIKQVNNVIKEIGAFDIPMLFLFNKVDMIGGISSKFFIKDIKLNYPNSLMVSAKNNTNIDEISCYIDKLLMKTNNKRKISVPFQMKSLIRYLDRKFSDAKVYNGLTKTYDYEVKISGKELEDINNQISKYKELRYINS